MTQEELKQIQLTPPDEEIRKRILGNWDRVAKPLDSLGEFERITARIGAITGTTELQIRPRAVLVMCADNGIVAEGVSQSGQEVSSIVTRFMGKGKSSVGKMAAQTDTDILVTDIGLADSESFFGVVDRKVRRGTRDFLTEPAMTEAETLTAIQIGIETVHEAAGKGYRILGTGEMGIGNTTTSSAVVAALLGCPVHEVTGRGAGLSDAAFERKQEVIACALQKYSFSTEETFRILMTVGGLDLAGLAGICIGGAVYHIPIVLDGLITAAAALIAERFVPGIKDYVMASHMSKEPAAERIMKELGLHPVIDAGLALGEGTGAVMFFSLLELVLVLYENGTTFEELQVQQYERSAGKAKNP